jgi:hypothetical protein
MSGRNGERPVWARREDVRLPVAAQTRPRLDVRVFAALLAALPVAFTLPDHPGRPLASFLRARGGGVCVSLCGCDSRLRLRHEVNWCAPTLYGAGTEHSHALTRLVSRCVGTTTCPSSLAATWATASWSCWWPSSEQSSRERRYATRVRVLVHFRTWLVLTSVALPFRHRHVPI